MRHHFLGKWTVQRVSTCVQPGLQIRRCKGCDLLEQREIPMRKHRAGKWTVSVNPSAYKAGEQVKLCKICSLVLKTRSYILPKSHFAVSFCSLGLRLRDVQPEKTDKWYMLTPLDLTQEGEYSYPLIADDKYIVGEIKVRLQDDSLTLSCRLFSSRSEILKPSIRFFGNLDEVSEKALETRKGSISFDNPMSIKHYFKDASYVLMSIRCEGIYDESDEQNVKYDDDLMSWDGLRTNAQQVQDMMKLITKNPDEFAH